jgi:hypothetical protein
MEHDGKIIKTEGRKLLLGALKLIGISGIIVFQTTEAYSNLTLIKVKYRT